MLTTRTAVSTLLTLTAASLANASPISFSSVWSGTTSQNGVPRPAGNAFINADLDGDGVQELAGMISFRVPESNLAQAPFTDIDLSATAVATGPGDRALRIAYSAIPLGGIYRQQMRAIFDVGSVPMPGAPMLLTATNFSSSPTPTGFISTFRIDFNDGRWIDARMTAQVDPRYRSLLSISRSLSPQSLDGYFQVEALSAISAGGQATEFGTMTIEGELVPAPGVLAILGGAIITVRRRRRHIE